MGGGGGGPNVVGRFKEKAMSPCQSSVIMMSLCRI